MAENAHKVSVRHLAEFILRSGSINTGFIVSAKRALEGTMVHQRIQKLRKKEVESSGGIYKKEVALSMEYEYNNIRFLIEGRADGLAFFDDEVTVEEIKSTLRPISQIEKDTSHWHWAQAKLYAYMQKKPQVTCFLIYSHVETGEWITFTEVFSFEELEAFVLGLIEKYWHFAKLEEDMVTEGRVSGQALEFPFSSYRRGQRELAVGIYAAIRNKKKLFAQAPTGTGKTMSALFPAVKAVSEGMGEKIFYCTSKTVQRHLAEDALGRMDGLKMRAITLTAKDKICFSSRVCNPESCEYADGHFDRVNDAILDCVRSETLITRHVVEEYARKHRLCPFEYAMDLSLFAHIIICDYNHVYNPTSKLKRFFEGSGKTGDYILLQDEAHNLVDRGREMFSASIRRKEFAEMRKEVGELYGKEHPLYKPLGKVAKAIRTFEDNLTAITATLRNFAEACEQHMSDDILAIYFTTLNFLRISELYDERYTTIKEPDHIRLFCLDPSYLLNLEQKKFRACVFFSATLTPLPYFQGILGGKCPSFQPVSDTNQLTNRLNEAASPAVKEEGNDYLLRLDSPFPRENLCLVIEGRISTKYKHRDLSLEAVAERIYTMVQSKSGNYMAFFPSYVYLNQVYEKFTERYGHVNVVRQQQKAGNEKDFLAQFKAGEALLGFAVLGGAFSEGVDLKGDRLIGVAIVGVGMPLISLERDLIKEHFNFKYAYTYPGMIKVLQAAGRLIRTEEDKGVVLLIDSRYLENDYKELFPSEWEGYVKLQNNRQSKLEDVLEDFWKQKQHSGSKNRALFDA